MTEYAIIYRRLFILIPMPRPLIGYKRYLTFSWHRIRLDENSTTVRIWAHFKSKGGSLLLERPGESKGTWTM